MSLIESDLLKILCPFYNKSCTSLFDILQMLFFAPVHPRAYKLSMIMLNILTETNYTYIVK